jgi:hypothetical protein
MADHTNSRHHRAHLGIPATYALLGLVLIAGTGTVRAGDFATSVLEYRPAPGQFINNPLFNDPTMALGAPIGGGADEPDNSKLVSLGAFGGSITLAFDHTVLDDPRNPLGLDAIVFGNAHHVGGSPNRRWAEPAHIEISRDLNGNGVADDPWYLIPGTHLPVPDAVWQTQGWDDDPATPAPPADVGWYPDPALYPYFGPSYDTGAYALPEVLFNPVIVENPNGLDADVEGILGYADCSPTLRLPDGADAATFYTTPDDPWTVGISEGTAGGDAFDIAWAVDAATGLPADLDGFDFIRITTATTYEPHILFGEKSTEIGGVADVRPAGPLGDINGDGVVDLVDLGILLAAFESRPGDPFWNPDADLNGDEIVDLSDLGALLADFDME